MRDLGNNCYAQFDADRKAITGTAQFDASGRLVLAEGAVYRCACRLAHGGHCKLVKVESEAAPVVVGA